jgi:DNA-binding CsgD family transcriptional regulator
MARTSKERGGQAGEPSAPPGLSSARFQRGDDEMAVLSFPLLPVTLPDSLSEAERKVALGLIAGKSTAEIAAERRTSIRTVANQIASLFAKLGVRSRLQLAALGGRTPRR